MKQEDENEYTKEEQGRLAIFFIIAVVFFIGIWHYVTERLKRVRSRRKLKSVIAEEYSVNQRILLRWIDIFCSEDYKKNYAKKNIKKIPQYDIYKTFGRPVRNEVFSKKRLASELYVHRNTLSNQMARIADFEEKTGMTLEQYNSLRTLPPKQYKLIVKLHQENYPCIPSLPK